LKQDAVPGAVNPLRITPIESGNFVVRCAELCGTDHAYMGARVTVMDPAEFEAWIQEQTAPPEGEITEADEIENGRELAELNGCFKCHTVDGSASDGPTWLNLYGGEETLVDGSTIIVDDEYLRRSILDPQAEIVAGFDDVDLPLNFAAVFEEQELDAVVDFIESLSRE
jgi:cytochrome c oxidase subunit 2